MGVEELHMKPAGADFNAFWKALPFSLGAFGCARSPLALKLLQGEGQRNRSHQSSSSNRWCGNEEAKLIVVASSHRPMKSDESQGYRRAIKETHEMLCSSEG